MGDYVAPAGWFLWSAKHEHTDVRFAGDHHVPLLCAGGPWIVKFQRYPTGGYLVEGRGHSLEEAWAHAIEAAWALDAKEPNTGKVFHVVYRDDADERHTLTVAFTDLPRRSALLRLNDYMTRIIGHRPYVVREVKVYG